jgi:hypothetical protein
MGESTFMLRATLLLTALPALATAAPAPFPRERKAADVGWSKPVDGLRVRMVAHKASYRVGETIRLTLEIQNVRDTAMAIEDPYLSGMVRDPASTQSGWSVTCEKRVECLHNPHERFKMLEELKRVDSYTLLAAGEKLRIEVRAQGGRLLEARKERARRRGEPIQARLYLSDADEPGVYEFRLTFRRDERLRERVLTKGWYGDAVTSPPVTIELRK